MNATNDLLPRCLHGEVTPADWHLLDSQLAADPALARQWCEAARLDAELSRLLAPPRAAKALAWYKPAALAAAAATVAAGIFFTMPTVEPLAFAPPARVAASEPEQANVKAPEDKNPIQPAPDPAPQPESKLTKFSRVITEQKVMALTFDDGPMGENTTRLLKILKDEGVKATFFPVGFNLERFPELAKQTAAEGHELANHSWTHPYLSRLPDDKFRSEIERSRDKLRELTGRNPDLFRPPYGAITAAQVELVAREYGCSTVLWSADPMDWKTRNAEAVKQAVIAQAKPGAIVLLHEIHSTTIDAVPCILQTLKADGWKFVTVTELTKLGPKVVAELKPVPSEKPAGIKAR